MNAREQDVRDRFNHAKVQLRSARQDVKAVITIARAQGRDRLRSDCEAVNGRIDLAYAWLRDIRDREDAVLGDGG